MERREWMQSVVDDARFALRQLRRSPGFATVAVLSLGMGIGATTTVFSVIDAFDFRPLPFSDAARLAWIAETTPRDDSMCSRCPFLTASSTLSDWVSNTRTLDAVAAIASDEFSWEHDNVREPQQVTQATSGFFGLLGVQPQIGRGFISDDTSAGAPRVAVVSDAFWRSRLGASAGVIGTQLQSIKETRAKSGLITIVGVLPQSFHFKGDTPIWTPLRIDGNASRTARSVAVVAHIASGHTLASAEAEIRALTSRLATLHPQAYRGWGVSVQPLRDYLTIHSGANRYILFAIAALVLLVAMLNVTGLLSTWAYARQQEFAVRSALGASRARVVRQLLVEGVCIGIAGGGTGFLLSIAAIRFVPRWFAVEETGLIVEVNERLLLFAAVLSVLIGIVAAIAPAIRAAGTDLGRTLRFRSTQLSTHGTRATATLLSIQIGVALLLVTAATILSRDYLAARYFDLGYNPDKLYSTTLLRSSGGSRDIETWRARAEEARERVAAVPGITFATLEHRSAIHPGIVRADSAQPFSESSALPVVKAVNIDYFKTFGTFLFRGREFTAADRRGAPFVTIVNKSAAARLWPRRNPIGRQVFVGDSARGGEWLTVIGVATDAERGELGERHWPMIYRPFAQAPMYHAAATLHVRLINQDAGALSLALAAIRQTMGQTVPPFASAFEQVSTKLVQRRLNAIALNLFALFGLLLAATGIYGSVAYAATLRTQEIGIRVALGATRSDIVTTLSRRGLQIAVAGVSTGMVSAFAITRILRSLVVATNPASPSLFAAAALLMACTVVVATLVPAFRATLSDPVRALRAE